METSEKNQLHALDHAWRYFELHANQRMSLFNFYVAFSTFLLAGLAASISNGEEFAMAGVVVGLLISFLSLVFWHLDGRTAFLVKHSENVISKLEGILFEEQVQVFATEKEKSDILRSKDKPFFHRMRSNRQSFKYIFSVFSLLGAVGSTYSMVSLLDAKGIILQKSVDTQLSKCRRSKDCKNANQR